MGGERGDAAKKRGKMNVPGSTSLLQHTEKLYYVKTIVQLAQMLQAELELRSCSAPWATGLWQPLPEAPARVAEQPAPAAQQPLKPAPAEGPAVQGSCEAMAPASVEAKKATRPGARQSAAAAGPSRADERAGRPEKAKEQHGWAQCSTCTKLTFLWRAKHSDYCLKCREDQPAGKREQDGEPPNSEQDSDGEEYDHLRRQCVRQMIANGEVVDPTDFENVFVVWKDGGDWKTTVRDCKNTSSAR